MLRDFPNRFCRPTPLPPIPNPHSPIPPVFLDAHAHLDQEDFDADRGEVIARARRAGVETVLCVGVSVESSRAAFAVGRAV